MSAAYGGRPLGAVSAVDESPPPPDDPLEDDVFMFFHGALDPLKVPPIVHVTQELRQAFSAGLQHMSVYAIEKVKKCNKREKWQNRVVVLLAHALYVCDASGEINRCITLPLIKAAFLKEKKGYCGLRIPDEYDLLLRFSEQGLSAFMSALRQLLVLQSAHPLQEVDCFAASHRSFMEYLKLEKPAEYAAYTYPSMAIVREFMAEQRRAADAEVVAAKVRAAASAPAAAASSSAPVDDPFAPAADDPFANADPSAKAQGDGAGDGGKEGSLPRCRYCKRMILAGNRSLRQHETACKEKHAAVVESSEPSEGSDEEIEEVLGEF